MEKTAIIFSDKDECKFLIGEGHWSRYYDVWVNYIKDQNTKKKNDHYDLYQGFNITEVDNDGFIKAIKDGADIIMCGFLFY